MKSYSKEPPSIRLLLLDVATLILAYALAAFARFGVVLEYIKSENYSILLIVCILVYIAVFYMTDSSTGFFRRGFTQELKMVISRNLLSVLCVSTILFLSKRGIIYARLFFIEFFVFYMCLNYLARQYYKVIMLTYFKESERSSKIMLITTYRKALEIIPKMKSANLSEQKITSIAILEKDMTGKEILGIPVKAGIHNFLETIRYETVDEVFISVPPRMQLYLEEIIEELELMGIKVKLNIDTFGLNIKEKKVESYSGYHVLVFNKKEYQASKLVIKRFIDIIGAMIGVLITGLLTIFIAPAILMESPGPVFFSQTRIGKNGRRFKIYKFRSMYPDAEERKLSLLGQNEMQGFMFKLSEDPRITKVGKFIRKTSIDEFPQFLNVLMGDMSLVGTRPPTEDEFLNYESRHRRRLTLKPGLTGIWQTSGRSSITNFEEVVRMDLEYIDNWSLGLDIKLIIKTVITVLTGRGAS
ncbi:exopolysaccharide biosynthesis polyprenyl glycosylphosphotransferase [Anaerocolumna sedimenticola]|uniref:Exopolysaccharide biosynthesis polyprenyl glycosylphosphotransferase n=1 Tax=Anaerocolumna sedimenticola TaxID=2696063 RepID=A0A6P1TIM8_9FIRM|nr:sugar transferase [Anaerocolumna sedimenticola]QHQ59969.1 exopolysaccharide biosynthesis polyprenyl glycosylphosphotransferase [Anaerocolumna sedimenticola]